MESFLFLAMNIAANQAIYPQTATHLPYPNGAIIQNSLQQQASIVRLCLEKYGNHRGSFRHLIRI